MRLRCERNSKWYVCWKNGDAGRQRFSYLGKVKEFSGIRMEKGESEIARHLDGIKGGNGVAGFHD
eukprot:scaffold10075_cov57-Attheya_sp.AAC.3